MTLLQLAKLSDVTFDRCDTQWGGTWAYRTCPSAKLKVCGFKTKKAAAESWLSGLAGSTKTFEAINQLLVISELAEKPVTEK